jgi:hypothetical protein
MWTAVLLGLLVVGGVLGQLSQTSGPVSVTTCDSSAVLSMSTSTTTQAIALAAGKSVYVCGFVLNADGKTDAKLVQGTGANCATGQMALTPAFHLTAGGSVGIGQGVGRLMSANPGSAVCVTNTSKSTLSVLLIYAQI